MKWTEGFHNQLRETFYEGQTDLLALTDPLPLRDQARCKKCARLWLNEDARTSPAQAVKRRCWLVTHKLVLCPGCLIAKVKSDE